MTTQHEEINQKILATEGWLKRYQVGVKQYQRNMTYENNERKIHEHVGLDTIETNQKLYAKETK